MFSAASLKWGGEEGLLLGLGKVLWTRPDAAPCPHTSSHQLTPPLPACSGLGQLSCSDPPHPSAAGCFAGGKQPSQAAPGQKIRLCMAGRPLRGQSQEAKHEPRPRELVRPVPSRLAAGRLLTPCPAEQRWPHTSCLLRQQPPASQGSTARSVQGSCPCKADAQSIRFPKAQCSWRQDPDHVSTQDALCLDAPCGTQGARARQQHGCSALLAAHTSSQESRRFGWRAAEQRQGLPQHPPGAQAQCPPHPIPTRHGPSASGLCSAAAQAAALNLPHPCLCCAAAAPEHTASTGTRSRLQQHRGCPAPARRVPQSGAGLTQAVLSCNWCPGHGAAAKQVSGKLCSKPPRPGEPGSPGTAGSTSTLQGAQPLRPGGMGRTMLG